MAKFVMTTWGLTVKKYRWHVMQLARVAYYVFCTIKFVAIAHLFALSPLALLYIAL